MTVHIEILEVLNGAGYIIYQNCSPAFKNKVMIKPIFRFFILSSIIWALVITLLIDLNLYEFLLLFMAILGYCIIGYIIHPGCFRMIYPEYFEINKELKTNDYADDMLYEI